MPAHTTSQRRIYAALMTDETEVAAWDDAIRRWSRADDGRDPLTEADR